MVGYREILRLNSFYDLQNGETSYSESNVELVVGDAVLMPSIVQMDMPNPELQSKNVDVWKTWDEACKKIDQDEEIPISDVLDRWRG